MGSVYVIKGTRVRKNDRQPNLEVQLCEDNGVPVDLSGATVRVYAVSTAGALQINGSCSIVSPNTDGRVTYQYTNTDTATAGQLLTEWEVTSSSLKRTFPTSGYARVFIDSELG